MYRTKQKIDYYNRFIESLKSEHTRCIYNNSLQLYLKDMDVTNINELIDDLGDPKKVKELEDNLIEYISYLSKEKNLAYSTVHTRLAAIFHFYVINRVNLNKVYISKFMPPKKKVMKDSAYTRQQITQMLLSCTTSQNVIVLLLASTGMRIGALHTLKLKHLKRIEVGNQHLYKVTVYDMEPEEYYTFTTFECAAAIDDYLEYRKRFGEKLKPDSPLIRKRFDHNDIVELRNPKHLSYHSFITTIDNILVASGIKERIPKKEGQPHDELLHQEKRCHGFRKFAITQMKLAKMDWGDREYLVGHRYSRGLDESYDRTDESDRLKEYLKAIDLLTIAEENRLRQKVQQLTIREDEVKELEKSIGEVRKMLGLSSLK